MAARTASTRKKAAAKAAPVVEPEEVEETIEDEEFDEVEEAEAAEAPAKKTGSRPVVEFGIRQVCELIKEKHGKDVTPRDLRVLARKLAKDGSGRIDRAIVAGNRSQYSWSGPNDPEVKALVKAFAAGEGEAEKKAKLDELKARQAEKKAAAPAKPAKKTAKKAAPVEVLEEEDFDDEDLDLDDDE